MLTELKVPELGKNIESITVVKVLAGPGDKVAVDQPLIELETGKAVVEVPATEAGTIRQFLVAVGAELSSGQVYATLETAAAAPAVTGAAKPAPAEPAPPPAASAAPAEAPAAVEPDHASTPPPSAPASAVRHVPAAPSVRRFAREIGIEVDTVRGTGPRGRVSLDDVKRHARDLNAARKAGRPVTGPEWPPLPDFSRWGQVRMEPMSAIRHATATHVLRSWLQVPRVTHFEQADITQLETLRRKYAERAEAAGGKLTMAVMVVKACAAALKRFPKFNAAVDLAGKRVIFKDYVHIGIAVATERGLLVPVLRDVDRKNLVTLAAEITAIAKSCRDGSIKPDQLEGGCFTVTNLGRIGGSYFTPIINHPEVAILGMGQTQEQVALRDGQVSNRTVLPLSLSYDHRLIDGADAAAFARWIAEAIQEPLVLALEG